MNDTKIVNKIKDNDSEAILYLMNKYSKLLWKIANGILLESGSVHDSEEVVADCFISLWKNPEKFDESRSNLKNYLCLLCKSKAIDKLRTLKTTTLCSLDDINIASVLDLDKEVIKAEELKLIEDAMVNLSDVEQEIFKRRFTYGQKPAEIAVAMSMPVKQIENYIYRAKEKLRNSITY